MIWIEYENVDVDAETETLIRKTAETAIRMEGARGDATVLLTDEAGIQRLNREFRNIDRVTDVLSFPAHEGTQLLAPADGYLGDIAICMPRAVEQGSLYGHGAGRETAFLTAHGVLHILGYDHMTKADEKRMRERQKDIMQEMELTVE